MQLRGVVFGTVTTECSAEEVICEILKTRNVALLALAVFLAVAVTAASSSPVFAQYYPCPPGYSYIGGNCYPGYSSPYNPYNNCQSGYYQSNCYSPGYNNPYNSPSYPYSNCQNGYYSNGYYYSGSNCYSPNYNNNYYNNYNNNYYSNNYNHNNYYHRWHHRHW